MDRKKSNHFADKLTLISKDEDMQKYCETLYLVGSCSRGEHYQSSDVDIIVIVRNISFVPKVLGILDVFRKYISQFEMSLDLRIYTKDSFKESYGGLDHFLLWSSIDSGLLILGDSIQVNLNFSLVISGLLHWIDRVNEVILSLEFQSHFKEACFVLHSALVWIYFIERYLCLVGKASLSKKQILEFFFQDMKYVIRSNYDDVVQKIRRRTAFPTRCKIQIKEKRDWSKLEYSKLLSIAEKITEYGNATYQKIAKRSVD